MRPRPLCGRPRGYVFSGRETSDRVTTAVACADEHVRPDPLCGQPRMARLPIAMSTDALDQTGGLAAVQNGGQVLQADRQDANHGDYCRAKDMRRRTRGRAKHSALSFPTGPENASSGMRNRAREGAGRFSRDPWYRVQR